jgi:hypothetical protein
MAKRSPAQRNDDYLMAAARVGIHKSILAALYAVQGKPPLTDGETGLGIAPAHRIPPSQVNTFPEQVHYAANTIRSLTDQLTAEGWQGDDLWNGVAGRYSDRFIARIAEGYSPPATDAAAARLEPVEEDVALLKAYLADLEVDYTGANLPSNLAYLDQALLAFVERVPSSYTQLPFQRQALLEAVRIWRKLDRQEAAIAALQIDSGAAGMVDETVLDQALTDFIRQADRSFAGYPNQREALIRLVQLWRQLDSREAAMGALAEANPDPNETDSELLDPALVAFVQALPGRYRGQGDQRFALTEGYRLWTGLDSRSAALKSLGLDPDGFIDRTDDAAARMQVAIAVDQALLRFWHRVPVEYQGTPAQREALIRLVAIWRRLDGRLPAVQSLLEDLRRMARANRGSVDAMPAPIRAMPPVRPEQWTVRTIQLGASIVPSGHLIWAEAIRGGTYWPPDQATVDAIVRIATLAQDARDRIGRPFIITSWYCPPEVNARVGGAAMSRHIVGDAIDIYCEGLTGQQLYWALDPWWPGGLGRYTQFPYVCHLDARGYRARWIH